MTLEPPASPGAPAALEELPRGISVVVPCYNSEATLEPLADELLDVLSRLGERFEIILVNDASEDGTWGRIVALAARHAQVLGINLSRNYGQHNATLCGVRLAGYAYTLTMDDDLQHPPSEIPKLLAALDDRHDVVYGVPDRRRQPLFRHLASLLTRWAVMLATGYRSVRELSAFRLFRTSMRGAFAQYRSPEVLFDALLGWGTTRVVGVVVRHDLRKAGRSNYGFFRLLKIVMMLWTGYTTTPLRLASLLGFAFVLFGIAVLVYMFALYFTTGTIPGFPFLASTIAIFGGVQLFTLGIIGEYLARVFNRSMDRPPYVVQASTSARAAPGAQAARGHANPAREV
jgi:undecaprenyl-phosphate 4-deoxy-4-formamido-L-arabinose transferase